MVGVARLPLQRNVTLVSLDDFGDPAVALKNMQLLDTVYNVLMVAAPAGNDPFDQLLSYAVQNRIPLVGPTVGLPNLCLPNQIGNPPPRGSWEAVALGVPLACHAGKSTTGQEVVS